MTDADPDLGRCFFEPDYSRTVEEVFVEVAKRLIAQKPTSLDFLGAAQTQQGFYDIGRGERDYDLPSWVPDWGVFAPRSLMPVTMPGERRISASSRLPPAEVAFDRSALLVSGAQADVVKDRRNLPSRGSFSWSVQSPSAAWKTLVEPLGNYPGGTSLPEAFCWTISGGNTWHGRRIMADGRAQHTADYEAFRLKYCVREDE